MTTDHRPILAAGTDVLTVDDLTTEEVHAVLDRASELKAHHHAGEPYRLLPDRSLGMLFHQPSTRTRISFEVGMTRLGGHALMLSPEHLQLGRGEPIEDTARVLSRYVDAVLIRKPEHRDIAAFADAAAVPTINGLSDHAHPCQLLADLLTIRETFDGFADVSAAWVGDGNNVARSFTVGCALTGIDLTIATPSGYGVGEATLDRARSLGGEPTVVTDPSNAVADADVVYTDVWTSMSDDDPDERRAALADYQVSAALLAGTDARVMHCLPAHRGEEITDDVLEGHRSLVWEQAENRLHAQTGLLVSVVG